MDFVSVAVFALGGLCILLLVVVLVQLRALGTAVAALAKPSAKSAPSAKNGDPALQSVLTELKRMEDQIGRFDIIFSEVQRQLAGLAHVKPARESTSAPADRPRAPDPLPQSPPARQFSAEPAPPPPQTRTDGASPVPATAARAPAFDAVASSEIPANLAELKQLTLQYRELITQPRKNEINRWSDEAGGWACEVAEDGTIQPLSRDAGGLLVLLTQDNRVGIIVPGGRMVVDFATSFSDVISMRRVTRQSFELLNDGTGVLRLMEPALAARAGDKWQLARPGKLAGFKSD